jgi:hypothetical protein
MTISCGRFPAIFVLCGTWTGVWSVDTRPDVAGALRRGDVPRASGAMRELNAVLCDSACGRDA